jgi:SAM-dependent methyltransferase
VTDLHYEHPTLVSLYDLGNGWSDDREFYLSLAGPAPMRILDLGCGTGLLCNAYAQRGHMVTGVDPAAPMLTAAKRSPLGSRIEWIQGSAQSFKSNTTFDLITMTGHAFQVLLKDEDVANTFSHVRSYLAPHGVFAFESRNPHILWAQEWDGMQREFESPFGIVRESFKVHSAKGEQIVFETEYTLPNERLVSVSELRFMSAETITNHLHSAGFSIYKLLGDWNGEPFNPEQSREMIFLVRVAGNNLDIRRGSLALRDTGSEFPSN